MAGEGEIRAMTETTNNALRLLLELMRRRNRNAPFLPRTEKPKELEPGEVKHSDLLAAARKRGEVPAMKEISRDDLPTLLEKAKSYGISISVVDESKPNVFGIVENAPPNVKVFYRASDSNIFEGIVHDIVKEKIDKHPDELKAAELNEWEVKAMQTELAENSVAVDIFRDKDGKYYCVYEKSDEKLFETSKRNLQKAHGEVVRDLGIKEDGNLIILQDKKLGRQISFDKNYAMGENELIDKLASSFDYDITKATMAAGKYADTLSPDKQARFFDPLNEINTASQLHLEGESALFSDFGFYHINLKEDAIDRFVIMTPDGQAAALGVDGAINKEILREIGVTDEKTVEAILDKHKEITEFYADRAKGLREIEITSDSKLAVERRSKDGFEINIGENKRDFSFSDKQTAVEEMSVWLRDEAGLGFTASRAMANQAFDRAQSQSIYEAAPSVQPEITPPDFEINREIGGTFTVTFGEIVNRYGMSDKDGAISALQEDFNISSEKANAIFEKAAEQNALEEETPPFESPYDVPPPDYEFANPPPEFNKYEDVEFGDLE